MDHQTFDYIFQTYIYEIWIGSAILGAIGFAGLVWEYLKDKNKSYRNND